MFSPMARTMSRPVARSLVKSDPPGELQGPLRTRLRVYLYGNGGRGVAGTIRGGVGWTVGIRPATLLGGLLRSLRLWCRYQLFGMLFLELHEMGHQTIG